MEDGCVALDTSLEECGKFFLPDSSALQFEGGNVYIDEVSLMLLGLENL